MSYPYPNQAVPPPRRNRGVKIAAIGCGGTVALLMLFTGCMVVVGASSEDSCVPSGRETTAPASESVSTPAPKASRSETGRDDKPAPRPSAPARSSDADTSDSGTSGDNDNDDGDLFSGGGSHSGGKWF